MKVCVDAGHGGSDPGAVGPTGLQEAAVNLRTAFLLKGRLEEQGYEVVLTRRDERALSANKAHDLRLRASRANSARVGAFVSIHCNSFSEWRASGTETWHFERSKGGERLAKLVQARLVMAGGLADRGVKASSTLAVLRYTNMPAIIVELAFISHPSEERLLQSGDWLAGMVSAISAGIGEWDAEK